MPQLQVNISHCLKPKPWSTNALQMLQIAVLEGWKLHATAFLISQVVANVLVLLLSMWQDRREWFKKKLTDASQADAGRRDDRKQPVLSLKGAASVKFTTKHGRSIAPRSRAQSWSGSLNRACHNTDSDHEVASVTSWTRGRSFARGRPLIELDTESHRSLSWLKRHSRPVERRQLLDEPSPGLRYMLSGADMNQNAGRETEGSMRPASSLPSPEWYDLNGEDGDDAGSLVSMGFDSATSL